MVRGGTLTLREVHFAIPGDLAALTGGYGYDRALIQHLPCAGWTPRHVHLPGNFPCPAAPDLRQAEAALAALPAGAVVLVDGLALGVMDEAAARLAARLRMVALVHHPLGDETGLASDVAERLFKSEMATLAHARCVICTSHTTSRRLHQHFRVPRERLHVARPGTARAARAQGSSNVPRILSVGSLTPRKGHDVLIGALSEIAHLPWTCRIVGDARNRMAARALRELISAKGLEGRVKLAGGLREIGPEYQSADLFALATRHEGYGMAFAEALAHGLPIIGTRAGAVAEVVPPDAGRLVPVDDLPALRVALEELLLDAAARRTAADAAWRAGQALPSWQDTAAAVAAALEAA